MGFGSSVVKKLKKTFIPSSTKLSWNNIEDNWNPFVGGPSAGAKEQFEKISGGKSQSEVIDKTIGRNKGITGVTTGGLAQIYRSQWADYRKRFAPLENELIDTYRNRAVHDKAIEAGAQQAAISADGAEESYDRNVQRFGVDTEQMSQEETDRAFDLARSKAIVDAKNRTRQALVDRDQGMLSGGITTGGVRKEGVAT